MTISAALFGMPVLVACATLLVLWFRAEPLLARLVTVAESRWTVKDLPPAAREHVPDVAQVPDDIQHMASRWSDEFAQGWVIARARELYDEQASAGITTDQERWDRVRVALHSEHEGRA